VIYHGTESEIKILIDRLEDPLFVLVNPLLNAILNNSAASLWLTMVVAASQMSPPCLGISQKASATSPFLRDFWRVDQLA
jgi:hypothetical protein